MALRDVTYSRLIAWLKILLPLAALVILSTVFLLSRERAPDGDVPLGDAGLSTRAMEERVTHPFYAGTTESGASLTVSAASARPDPAQEGAALAEGLEARLRLTDGSRVTITARGGAVDAEAGRAALTGGVVLRSSAGYRVETETLRAALNRVEITSDGSVTATAPMGRLEAGRMRLVEGEGTENARMLFTRGVRLLYDPANQGGSP